MYSSSCFLSSEWLSVFGQSSDVDGQNGSSELRHPAMKFNTRFSSVYITATLTTITVWNLKKKRVLLKHVRVRWERFVWNFCLTQLLHVVLTVTEHSYQIHDRQCTGVVRYTQSKKTKKHFQQRNCKCFICNYAKLHPNYFPFKHKKLKITANTTKI